VPSLEKPLLDLCFNTPPNQLKPLLDKAFQLTRRNFTNSIHFYFPGMVHFEASFYESINRLRFPGISVTGNVCKLNCEHCRGQLLEGMVPAMTPEMLLKVCLEVKTAGGRGCLVTGGSLGDGSVPLMKFIPTLKRIKEELGLRVVVHTGLVDKGLAEALSDTGVDAAMIDIIGSDETIKQVYRLDRKADEYEYSLSLLSERRIPIVPHIVVGIHYGQLRGEKTALQIISRHNPAAVVIVVLTPLHGTPMEKVLPPPPMAVARILLGARLIMPSTPLLLGCARPKGALKPTIDVLAIRAGANGIAYPSEEAYMFARRLGLQVKLHEECCSLLWREFFPSG